jgi:hypothetical protein
MLFNAGTQWGVGHRNLAYLSVRSVGCLLSDDRRPALVHRRSVLRGSCHALRASRRQIQPVEAFDSTSSVNNSEGFFQL